MKKGSKVTEISEREMNLRYKDYLFDIVIPSSNLLNEATFYGKPLCLYKIDSEGAIAYLELAYKILKNNSSKMITSENISTNE